MLINIWSFGRNICINTDDISSIEAPVIDKGMNFRKCRSSTRSQITMKAGNIVIVDKTPAQVMRLIEDKTNP